MGRVVPLRARRADEPSLAEADAALVAAAREGDRRARDALYRRHAPMVLGLAHRLLAGASDADDLLQDVFVIALGGLHRLEDPQALASWLGGITVRLARRRLRYARLRAKLGLGTPIDAERLVSPDAPPDVGAELRTLYRMLATLRPDARVALVLRRVEGMTIAEIASSMERSPATVKRYIDEAEVLLRAELERGGRSS